MASQNPGIAGVGSDGTCKVLTPVWHSGTASWRMGRRGRNLEGQRYFRWFRRKGILYWAGAYIPAVDAVSILLGFGGRLCHMGAPPKHRSLSNLVPSREAPAIPAACAPDRLEHLCLCPQGLLS